MFVRPALGRLVAGRPAAVLLSLRRLSTSLSAEPKQNVFSDFVEHSTRPLSHGDLLFVAEPVDPSVRLDLAVQSIGQATILWLQRHGALVSRPFHIVQHVGMVVADQFGHAEKVVEAQRVAGVRVLSLPDFLGEFVPGSRFFHAWLPEATKEQRQSAVSYALHRVGAAYAHDFSEPNQKCARQSKYYCSSLVDYAYREALGQDLVFSDEAFPLVFEPRVFWEEFYREQSMGLPSGCGSNPTMLLHSSRVRYARYEPFKTVEEECHEMF
mmetsp:Transcript_105220/g.226898  ORF Transcript_105220/g.226898 Transcript_105220/m.226898 type:complete len:268 (+) Transcript_105220:28-831(+)